VSHCGEGARRQRDEPLAKYSQQSTDNYKSWQVVNALALVDTGATYTIVPWSVYEKLNLMIIGKKMVETAKGPTELDESFLVIEIKGKRAVTPVLISRDLKDVLVGVLTLEALGLAVDPTTGELKESRILLL
jgi:clan AA aspartic protease